MNLHNKKEAEQAERENSHLNNCLKVIDEIMKECRIVDKQEDMVDISKKNEWRKLSTGCAIWRRKS